MDEYELDNPSTSNLGRLVEWDAGTLRFSSAALEAQFRRFYDYHHSSGYDRYALAAHTVRIGLRCFPSRPLEAPP